MKSKFLSVIEWVSRYDKLVFWFFKFMGFIKINYELYLRYKNFYNFINKELFNRES